MAVVGVLAAPSGAALDLAVRAAHAFGPRFDFRFQFGYHPLSSARPGEATADDRAPWMRFDARHHSAVFGGPELRLPVDQQLVDVFDRQELGIVRRRETSAPFRIVRHYSWPDTSPISTCLPCRPNVGAEFPEKVMSAMRP